MAPPTPAPLRAADNLALCNRHFRGLASAWVAQGVSRRVRIAKRFTRLPRFLHQRERIDISIVDVFWTSPARYEQSPAATVGESAEGFGGFMASTLQPEEMMASQNDCGRCEKWPEPRNLDFAFRVNRTALERGNEQLQMSSPRSLL